MNRDEQLAQLMLDDALYEWCRKSPYIVAWGENVRLIRQDTGEVAAVGDDVYRFPPMVRVARAAALGWSHVIDGPAQERSK